MTAIENLRTYLCLSINSFLADPADTDYQEGYEAALRECLEELDRLYAQQVADERLDKFYERTG